MTYSIEEYGRADAHVGVMVYTAEGNLRTLHDIEADIICLAINRYGGSKEAAAHYLNIGRSTLYRRLGEIEGRAPDEVRSGQAAF